VSRDVELKLRLTADGRVLVSQVKKGKKEVDAFGIAVDKAGKKTKGFSDSLKTLEGFAAGLGLAKLANDVLNTNREMEALRTQLVSVTGSGQKAAAVFQDLQGFAAETPFQLQQLTQMYVNLENFGLTPTRDVMEAITNQASKLGASQETLRSIVLQLGQAYSKGRLQQEDAIILAERGVPVYKILAEVTGKNTQQLQEMSAKGKIGRDIIQQLIVKMGELASGSNARAMDTLNGRISNLSDAWTRFQDTLLTSESENIIKRIVLNWTAWLDYFTGKLSESEGLLNTEIRNITTQIVETKQKIKELEALKQDGSFFTSRTGIEKALEKQNAKLQSLLSKRVVLLEKYRADLRKNTPSDVPSTSTTSALSGSSSDTTVAKTARAYQDATGPASEWLKLQQQAEQVIRQTRTPLERLNKSIAQYSTLADRGLISQETLNRALKQAGEEYNRLSHSADENNSKMTVYAEQAARNIQDAFANFLFDPFNQGLDGMLKGFARVLQRMAAEQAASAIFGEGGLFGKKGLNGLVKSGANAASSVIADVVASFFHTGGIAGSPAVAHAVPASAFAGAPRYHSGGLAGLKPNEVPAILQRGEEVLTANDPRHRNNFGGGLTINMTVVTDNADSFRRSEGQIGFDMAEELKRWKDING